MCYKNFKVGYSGQSWHFLTERYTAGTLSILWESLALIIMLQVTFT